MVVSFLHLFPRNNFYSLQNSYEVMSEYQGIKRSWKSPVGIGGLIGQRRLKRNEKIRSKWILKALVVARSNLIAPSKDWNISEDLPSIKDGHLRGTFRSDLQLLLMVLSLPLTFLFLKGLLCRSSRRCSIFL